MPEPRNIAPEKPRFFARSGVTTPMSTVRCFQMRLSVRSVSYSSTNLGKRLVKSSMKLSKEPERPSFKRATDLALRTLLALY